MESVDLRALGAEAADVDDELEERRDALETVMTTLRVAVGAEPPKGEGEDQWMENTRMLLRMVRAILEVPQPEEVAS